MPKIDHSLVGEVWPDAHPEDPVLDGHVESTSTGEFEVKSLQIFELIYTVGRCTSSIQRVIHELGTV